MRPWIIVAATIIASVTNAAAGHGAAGDFLDAKLRLRSKNWRTGGSRAGRNHRQRQFER
jgi:hypothetical protein